jgi:hypothetical protein
MGRIAGILACGALIVATVVAAAPPASAHGVAGVQPSNYETRVLAITPAADGVEVEPIDLGNRVELRNDADEDVFVLGYDGEPYLRVGPDGAFENMRSPATYANRDRRGGAIPETADAKAEPEWRKIRSEPMVRWHDHRAHWMGGDRPVGVQEHPRRRQVVQEWEIKLRRGDRILTVTGDVMWVPGPAPLPWLVIAALLGLAVVLASRTRYWALVLGIAIGVLGALELAHVIGLWNGTTASIATKLAASMYSLGGIAVGVAAVVWLIIARDPYDASPLALIAGLFLFVSGGLADVSTLSRSQLPTTLPPIAARTGVAAALGLGVGVMIAAALRMRRPARVSA